MMSQSETLWSKKDRREICVCLVIIHTLICFYRLCFWLCLQRKKSRATFLICVWLFRSVFLICSAPLATRSLLSYVGNRRQHGDDNEQRCFRKTDTKTSKSYSDVPVRATDWNSLVKSLTGANALSKKAPLWSRGEPQHGCCATLMNSSLDMFLLQSEPFLCLTRNKSRSRKSLSLKSCKGSNKSHGILGLNKTDFTH